MKTTSYKCTFLFIAMFFLIVGNYKTYAQDDWCYAASNSSDIEIHSATFRAEPKDKILTSRMGRALVRLSQTFRVLPDFAIYKGETAKESLGAKASSTTLPFLSFLQQRDDGIVLLGDEYLNVLGKDSDLGMTLLAVIAHEFAHIAQFKYGLRDNNITIRELHADYLAGYYLGLTKRRLPNIDELRSVEFFKSIGGKDEDHGSAAERAKSLRMGFRVGSEQQTIIDQYTLDKSMKDVKTQFPY